MYKLKEIADGVFYVGVNDRQKALFENLWPLPYGVSYNSYLLLDEKTVLIDTVDAACADVFLKKVEDALQGRPLDYLVVDHMEPDHAGSIRLLRLLYPEARIVGNKRTFDMLEGFHGIRGGLLEVKDGDTLDTGSRRLSFHFAPMVHWPEVMVAYDAGAKLLFSADAFGTYGALDGAVLDTDLDAGRYWDEMRRYYANIVGKYGNPVQKALRKLSGLEINAICPAHGPVWTAHIPEVVGIYNALSRYEGQEGAVVVYGSMYGNTAQMAEAVAESLAWHGVKDIAVHDAGKSHASFILRDIFKYKAVAIGCPTYNNGLFPAIDALLRMIEAREVKNRLFACFGSFAWAGAAVKTLSSFGEKMGWEAVGAPVEQKQGLKPDKYEACWELGKALAERTRGFFGQD